MFGASPPGGSRGTRGSNPSLNEPGPHAAILFRPATHGVDHRLAGLRRAEPLGSLATVGGGHPDDHARRTDSPIEAHSSPWEMNITAVTTSYGGRYVPGCLSVVCPPSMACPSLTEGPAGPA